MRGTKLMIYTTNFSIKFLVVEQSHIPTACYFLAPPSIYLPSFLHNSIGYHLTLIRKLKQFSSCRILIPIIHHAKRHLTTFYGRMENVCVIHIFIVISDASFSLLTYSPSLVPAPANKRTGFTAVSCTILLHNKWGNKSLFPFFITVFIIIVFIPAESYGCINSHYQSYIQSIRRM